MKKENLEIVAGKRKLLPEEFWRLELLAKDQECVRLEKEFLLLSLSEAGAKLSVAKYMQRDLEAKILEIKAELKKFQDRQKSVSENRQGFVEKIKKRLGIEKSFGYDPETHDVIEDGED